MICYPSEKVYFPISKIQKFLLLPGTKHYNEFHAVDFLPSNDFELFKQIESQFDKRKAEGYRYSKQL